ncbi:TPA: hypothetical protein HA361_01720 [Candidatus Woesearchaeota archaeon]|nr:hypothetical protein [Candidatus Woesearchaeota archaeon]HII68849.1 hypothetical protein [Candidatus Woesearchaeota archaeon]
MRKDVNFGLLLLIVAVLITFAGFTTYYQSVFSTVESNYTQKIAELTAIKDSLETARENLSETLTFKSTKLEDYEALDEQFLDVAKERDQFSEDNTKLKSELSKARTELIKKEEDLANKDKQITDLSADLTSERAENEELLDDINDLSDKAQCLKDTADANEGTCS